MCRSCWVEHGKPVVYDQDIAETAMLIRRLYELCPTGGPLHVELEDMNLDRAVIVPMYGSPDRMGAHGLIPGYPDRYSVEVHKICDRIAELLTAMPEGWRASACAHAFGWAVDGAVVVEEAPR